MTCSHENVIAECDNCGARLLYTPLAEVNALRTENARLTAANKWVSVKVALPEKDGQYLVVNNNSNNPKTKLCSYTKAAYRDLEENTFYHSENTIDGCDYFEDEVTHFMPLPTPPTGGE